MDYWVSHLLHQISHLRPKLIIFVFAQPCGTSYYQVRSDTAALFNVLLHQANNDVQHIIHLLKYGRGSGAVRQRCGNGGGVVVGD